MSLFPGTQGPFALYKDNMAHKKKPMMKAKEKESKAMKSHPDKAQDVRLISKMMKKEEHKLKGKK